MLNVMSMLKLNVPEVVGVPQQSVSMNLAVNGPAADVEPRRRGADVPVAHLERLAQRVSFRLAQHAPAVVRGLTRLVKAIVRRAAGLPTNPRGRTAYWNYRPGPKTPWPCLVET